MITAIICAAGGGHRAALGENKIFYELNGMPVLCHALSAFAPYADEILVAARAEDFARTAPLLTPYPNARLVEGGQTRAESVYRALREASSDMVLIHDAARPFVTKKIVEDCIASVREFGSGVCSLPATDTTVLAEGGTIREVPPRSTVATVQTPQGFVTEKLRAAYERAYSEGRLADFTDDSGLYTFYCEPAHLFTGDSANRKLTYAEDFRQTARVGFGVDTHAFDIPKDYYKGIRRLSLNYIILGGAVIPAQFSLRAHSDGDVLVHALMDALLSAIGERDIGYHFPDTDPAYEGAKSMQLLARVMEMVKGAGFSVKNASICVLAEQPKLSPYIDEMRDNLRAALSCEHVAVAAGTNEKLGYIGEGKGITVYAYVLLNPLSPSVIPNPLVG